MAPNHSFLVLADLFDSSNNAIIGIRKKGLHYQMLVPKVVQIGRLGDENLLPNQVNRMQFVNFHVANGDAFLLGGIAIVKGPIFPHVAELGLFGKSSFAALQVD
jgi:hypothetical protein